MLFHLGAEVFLWSWEQLAYESFTVTASNISAQEPTEDAFDGMSWSEGVDTVLSWPHSGMHMFYIFILF